MTTHRIRLTVVLVLLSLVVPAAARAGTVTSSAGVLAPVGTTLTGRSSDAEIATSLGTITCLEMVVQVKIQENSFGRLEAGVPNYGTSSACALKGGGEVTTTTITVPRLQSFTAGSGTMGLSFGADLPGGLSCSYTAFAVPFTYKAGSSTILVAGNMKPSPAACGTEAKTKFRAEFKVTIGSTPVILD